MANGQEPTGLLVAFSSVEVTCPLSGPVPPLESFLRTIAEKQGGGIIAVLTGVLSPREDLQAVMLRILAGVASLGERP